MMAEWSESVWVVVEAAQGPEPDRSALEALSQARDLTRISGGGVRVVVLASAEVPAMQLETWLRRGASQVVVLQVAALAEPDSSVRVDLLNRLLQRGRPRILLAAMSDLAGAWTARLAARLSSPIVTQCIQAVVVQGSLRVRRSMCRNTVHLTQEFRLEPEQAPAVLLMATGCWRPAEDLDFASGGDQSSLLDRIEVVAEAEPPCERAAAVQLITRTMPEEGAVDLSEAELVFSGGGGLGGPEGFAELRAVARQVGAAVGASRLAVDRGWAGPAEQIGISGQNIAPRVYVAFGISGAREHLSGVSDSENIVAVNIDRNAPIAKAAKALVPADARTVLSALSAEAQRRLRETANRK